MFVEFNINGEKHLFNINKIISISDLGDNSCSIMFDTFGNQFSELVIDEKYQDIVKDRLYREIIPNKYRFIDND